MMVSLYTLPYFQKNTEISRARDNNVSLWIKYKPVSVAHFLGKFIYNKRNLTPDNKSLSGYEKYGEKNKDQT